MISYIGELRARSLGGLDFDDKAHSTWNTRFNSVPVEQRDHAERLFNFLFPNWRESRFGSQVRVPQGIAAGGPVDYWVRLNAEELPPSEIRDQEILFAITGWLDETADAEQQDLPNFVHESEAFAGKVMHFGRFYLDTASCRRLATSIHAIALQERSMGSRSLNDYPEIEMLARFYSELAQREPQGKYYDWIVKELEESIPVSLRFAMGIVSMWGIKTISQDKELQKRIWEHFVCMLKSLVTQDPSVLVESLRDGNGKEFLALMVDQSYGKRWENPPESWTWLSDALVRIFSEAPEISAPQLARLLYNKVNHKLQITPAKGSHICTYHRDEELFKILFPRRRQTVLRILTADIDRSRFDDEVQCVLSQAQAEAKEELTELTKKTASRRKEKSKK